MGKESFVAYYSWEKCCKGMTKEQIGELCLAVYDFEIRGVVYGGQDAMVQMAFNFISDSLMRNREKYESIRKKRSEAGRRGGYAANASKCQQNKQMPTSDSVNVNGNVNVNVNDNVYVNGDGECTQQAGSHAPTPEREPPSLEEVRRYAAEHGMKTSPDRFWEYYNARRWMAGHAYIGASWRDKLREWDETEYGGRRSGQSVRRPQQSGDKAGPDIQAEDIEWLQKYMELRGKGETE